VLQQLAPMISCGQRVSDISVTSARPLCTPHCYR